MTEIPLFPLSSVLFPGGRMPLQIFEQRYIELVRRCMKQSSGFGLTWLARGQEVARAGVGELQLSPIGCYARIVDFDSLPNGLLGITIEGGERYCLAETRVESDKLVLGQVTLEDPRSPVPVAPEWDSLVDVLTSLEQHPHVKGLGIAPDHSDAWQVGYALAQLLPVEDAIKYELLCEDEVEPFMERLDELLNELGGLVA